MQVGILPRLAQPAGFHSGGLHTQAQCLLSPLWSLGMRDTLPTRPFRKASAGSHRRLQALSHCWLWD